MPADNPVSAAPNAPAAGPLPMSQADDPAALARRVMRATDRAVLATAYRPNAAEEALPEAPGLVGWPYASLVLTALTPCGEPLLLISTLAEHTRAIAADGRVSLLFDGTAGLDDPLTGPRVTVSGRAERSEIPADRQRFLARHPAATLYADFKDFAFYRVRVARAHLVAGFGRIHRIAASALLLPEAEVAALAAAEAEVVAHMNADHADAVALYATALLGATPTGPDMPWRMTGVDPEGADLRCGGKVLRLPFDKLAHDAEAARVELVRLVKRARRG